MLRYLVLGLLRDGKPRHGYALMKAYGAVSDRRISTGNFYRELARLLASGCVETAERAVNSDPRRTPYRITARGAACFDDWFTVPLGALPAERVDDLGLRLVVLRGVERETVGHILERWKDDLWLHVKLLEKSRDHIASHGTGSDRMRSFIIDRRLGHLSVDIELLDALRRELGLETSAADAGGPPQASVAQPPQPRRPVPAPRTTTSRRP